MQTKCISLSLLFSIFLVSCGSHKLDGLALERLYLGQEPPGSTPERFVPGIISTEHWEYSGTFTPDLKEFYFLRNGGKHEKPTFVVFRYEDGQWRESVVSRWVGQPFISPDGKTMHLGAKYMERTADGWSEVKSLGPMFDREDWAIMRLSSSAQGTYVLDDFKSGDVIRMSTLKDGVRQEPELLGKEINTGKFNAHPFIAPDGSYLIWDGERDEGFGDSDLWISYRREDGSWGDAINLGDSINTSVWEAGASVTPDGKFLLFNRSVPSENSADPYPVDIFWVSAEFIGRLKPKVESK